VAEQKKESVCVIAVVGLCGSGKTVVSDHLASQGFHKIHFGDLTLRTLDERGLPTGEDNERQVREELREHFGMGVYAERALPEIDEVLEAGKKVLIDGLYSFEEYKVLKKRFGDGLLVVAVYAPPELRYARLAARPERPLSMTEAVERDMAEIEKLDKGGPIAMADVIIMNDSYLERLHERVNSVLAGQRATGST